MMGGSKENRHTPGLEHWSIAVKNGKILEKNWRAEIPILRGGPHRFVICFLLYYNGSNIRLTGRIFLQPFICLTNSALFG